MPTRWRVGLIALLLGLLYAKTLWKVVLDWWTDPNFSHGFVVPLFAGFLIWTRRKQLASIELRPAWHGLWIVLLGLCMLILGVLGAELFVSRCSFLVVLAGLIIYFLGFEFFRAVRFAWAFLFLMFPIPAIIFNQITLPLQLFASQAASWILPLLGVPVLRLGNIIQLPTTSLEVAVACSGIRSLMSLTTFALIYGYFAESRRLVRILLGLAAIPIAVASNAARIVGTGLLIQYWDADKALGFFHEFSGVLIFVVSLILLFFLHKALSIPELRFKSREVNAAFIDAKSRALN